MYIVDYRRRLEAAFILFFLFFIFCVSRLFYIQLFRADYLARIAKKQHNLYVELEPRRGTIYDTNLKPQAVNLAYESVYASPNEIKGSDKEHVIKELAAILKLDEGYLRERIWRKKSFIWLARKIDPRQAAEVRKSNLKGIGFLKESKRCYANGYLMSHILGFAGLDNNGLEGLELYLDKYLKGQPGWAFMLRDARSKQLNIYNNMALAKDGSDVVLTVDEVIQYIAERELDKAYRMHHAKAASIIVMNPKTGEILALANRPSYDLNSLGRRNKEQVRNRAICDLFEPGSVFKIVTASAALAENKVQEQDKFFCEYGKYKIAGHILHDHKQHGWLTFQEVIELSSNIGTSKVAQILGADIVYKYAKLFGFGSKLGVDMPGEISGMIKEPRFWSKTSIAAVPMGQEVGVTAVQLVAALSAIANGGLLMKPYIVKEIRDKENQNVKEFSPVVIRRVISEEVAARMRKILTGVIETGTGNLAKMKQFTAGGKTGTAQKLDPNGRYSHDKYVGSFMGFAPAEDPVLAVIVTIDEPHPYYFGGVVAAPVFKNVVADSLKYLKSKEYPNNTMVLNENKRAR